MLRKLYGLVAQGKPWSTSELAQELGIPPQLVTTMLEDLVRRGLLQDVAKGCGVSCDSCSQAGRCAIGSPERVWSLSGVDGPTTVDW